MVTEAQLKATYHPYLDNAPRSVIDHLIAGHDSPEHPVYHPEGTLGAHIEIVFKRAKARGDATLVMCAILHDLFKYTTGLDNDGHMKELPEGTYWTNPTHDVQGRNFIEDDPQVYNWIASSDADPQVVGRICRNHMRMKDYIRGMYNIKGAMSKKRALEFRTTNKDIFGRMLDFSIFDDMLNRWE